MLHVVSEDRTLGGIVEIGPDDESVTIVVSPHATASGRLIDGETNQPVPNAELQYGVHVHLGGKDDPFRSSFGGSATTSERGEFTLPRLVAGQEYHVNVVSERNYYGYAQRLRGVTTLRPESAGASIDLGDAVIKPDPRAQSFEERVAAAFQKPDPAATRYQNSLRDIRIGHLRMLLIFADPNAEPTRQFFKLRYDDGDVRPQTDNYWLTPLPTTGDKADDTRSLAVRLGLELGDGKGPLFVVIDEHEARLAMLSTAELTTDGAIDKQKVLAFLAACTPEQLDAQVLFDEALARAQQENKRVFIQESATWCGPCWMLSRFLAAHHEALEKDFIFVKLDHRWPHAREIAERFRGAEYGGIPWCAILDAQAQVLATSDGPDGNIGFPSKSEPRAIEHFISMLRDSRIRLTDDELGQIRANLEQ